MNSLWSRINSNASYSDVRATPITNHSLDGSPSVCSDGGSRNNSAGRYQRRLERKSLDANKVYRDQQVLLLRRETLRQNIRCLRKSTVDECSKILDSIIGYCECRANCRPPAPRKRRAASCLDTERVGAGCSTGGCGGYTPSGWNRLMTIHSLQCDNPCCPCRCDDPCICDPCSPCPRPCSPCPRPCSPCPRPCSPCPRPCSPCPRPCSPCPRPCSCCPRPCSPCPRPCSPCPRPCSPCPRPCSPCPCPCSCCPPCPEAKRKTPRRPKRSNICNSKLTDENDSAMNARPCTKILGELAFQLERRILDYVFGAEDNKRRRFYGYTVSNIKEMLDKECKNVKGEEDAAMRFEMEQSIKFLTMELERIGYDMKFHADFAQQMINRYGLLACTPDPDIVEEFGLQHVRCISKLITQLARGEHEASNLQDLLRALKYMSKQDGLPLFVW